MFHYYQPTKIHFGAGQLNELGHVCRGYGKTCFLVTTPDAPLQPLYERVKKLLDAEGISVIHFDKVEPNPSVEIVEQGFAMLKEQPADFVLAVGGGSSIDTAKAIAFANGKESIDWDHLFNEYSSPFAYYPSYSEKHLPLLSVPTTSGTGSQVTQAAVITRGKEKITFFHPDNFSQETILDPQLMLTLPKRMSAATGFDAFTHAFESYINANASPYSAMDSMEAMRLVIDHLPHVLEDPQNLEFRTNMCLAWLAAHWLIPVQVHRIRSLKLLAELYICRTGKHWLSFSLPSFSIWQIKTRSVLRMSQSCLAVTIYIRQ